jgi:hypothetical protein
MCWPMMKAKGLRVFELVILHDDRRKLDFAADTPFKIVKVPDRFANADAV